MNGRLNSGAVMLVCAALIILMLFVVPAVKAVV